MLQLLHRIKISQGCQSQVVYMYNLLACFVLCTLFPIDVPPSSGVPRWSKDQVVFLHHRGCCRPALTRLHIGTPQNDSTTIPNRTIQSLLGQAVRRRTRRTIQFSNGLDRRYALCEDRRFDSVRRHSFLLRPPREHAGPSGPCRTCQTCSDMLDMPIGWSC